MKSQKLIVIVAVVLIAGVGVMVGLPMLSGPKVGAPVGLASTSGLDPMVISAIDKALESAEAMPEAADRRAALGMVYHAHDLYEPAIRSYEQSLQLQDDDARTWYLLADALARQGRTEASLAVFDSLFAHDSTSAAAYIAHGQLLLDAGRPSDASTSFRKASQIDGSNPGSFVGLARVAIVEGRDSDAVTTLQSLVSGGIDHPYVHHLLGMALQRLGRGDEAALHTSRSSGERPSWPDPWRVVMLEKRTGYQPILESSQQMMASGQAQGAIRKLQSLEQAFPGDVTVLNYLAQAYQLTNDRLSAEATLQRALSLDPNSVSTLVNLSRLFETNGDMSRAMNSAISAVEAQPTSGPALLQLGRLQVMVQRLDAAADTLRAAVQNGIDGEPDRIMYASVLMALNRWEDAARTLEQVVGRYPGSVAGWANLARAQSELRRFDEAMASLERARQLDAQDPKVRETMQRLNQLRQLGG